MHIRFFNVLFMIIVMLIVNLACSLRSVDFFGASDLPDETESAAKDIFQEDALFDEPILADQPATSPTTVEPSFETGSTRVNPVDGAVMVYVPTGEFLMGNDFAVFAPEHTVYLDSFWLYRTEVTNQQYRICVDDGDCDLPTYARFITDPKYDNHPVGYVKWFDAAAYCQWARGRLPTEAEWEKAARGIDGREYPWGNDPLTGDKANFCDVNCSLNWAVTYMDDGYETTSPVGSYPLGVSPYGAFDMAGNVEEWVADWYDQDYYSYSPFENPQGPSDGIYRVYRGGSYYKNASFSSNTFLVWERGRFPPDLSYHFLGFRCVQSATP